MQKDADAFRTISEVAKDLSLPQHVLRFWETRFPQIRPLKRAGGRRYYRPADVALLKTVRQLLYDDGYTIKGVQRLLKEQGAKGLRGETRDSESIARLDGEDLEVSADGGDADLEDIPPATDLVAMDMSFLIDAHRDVVEATLATVEECKRILDAISRPASST
jgi:DNA-binding transcriptional MerR regulator